MPDQLESALVIVLRETIAWESATEDAASAGTLTAIDPVKAFDALQYQSRDRQLAFRDLISAAAVVRVSVEISNIWNYEATKPRLQGAVNPQMVHQPAEAANLDSRVRHVGNTSVPKDAFQVADKDLYGRDALVYEILARACQTGFTTPPIQRIDAAGTILNTSIWSLGQGQHTQADINPALPLNRDLFKLPDQNLADRDNQMAGYVSRIIQVLKNPFENADRLYVSVSGVDTREPEIYTYTRIYWQARSYQSGREVYYQGHWYRAQVDTASSPSSSDWVPIDKPVKRVFVADPALGCRNRIIYDTQAKTLQWLRERTDAVHIPQIYAMSIPGILPGQLLNTLPQIPELKDAQYWRAKAAQIVPAGEKLIDRAYLEFTTSDQVTGGVPQITAASMTVPDTLLINLPVVSQPDSPDGALSAGQQRVTVLTRPNQKVEIVGAQNNVGTGGTLGGATYLTAVASGSVLPSTDYLVQGGDGVVYAGQTFSPGDTFTGLNGTNTFTALGGSTIRQFSTVFSLPLPIGAWMLQLDYTNLQGTTSGFGIRASYLAAGHDPTTILADAVPLPYIDGNGEPLPNGQLVTSSAVGFDVVNTDNFVLPIYWTSGGGQFHLRKLTFTSEALTGRYAMAGTLIANGTTLAGVAKVDVTGQSDMPDVLVFDLTTGSAAAPLQFKLAWSASPDLPIQVTQAQVQSVGTFVPTPNSGNFAGWRWEMTERAARAIQQSYHTALEAYGSNTPIFRSSGSEWGAGATDAWMSFIEVFQPRLREVPNISSDAIVAGRQYVVSGSASVSYGSGVYTNGKTFYGLPGLSSYTSTSATAVTQVGATLKARPGCVGKPALVPSGVAFQYGTINAHYDSFTSLPLVAACQPWMIEAGMYVFQPEFWLSESMSPGNGNAPCDVFDLVTVERPPGTGSDSSSLGATFRDGNYDPHLFEEVTATSIFSSGNYFNTVVDVPVQIDGGTLTTAFSTGTYFATVLTGTYTESGTLTTAFSTGTYWATVLVSSPTESGTLTTAFSIGTYPLVIVLADTQTESGTHTTAFSTGSYGG